MPFIHPHGMIVWNHLLDYCRETWRNNNYVEIKTPLILVRELWETPATGRITATICSAL